jgi:hypothetical protein
MAQTVRMALNRTSTPPPADAGPSSQPQLELDTAAIDAGLGTTGTNDGGIYKFSFQRNEPITGAHGVLAPGMGITTAINFQPTGDGRAAINGDFAMLAEEVQPVTSARRADVVRADRGAQGLGEFHRVVVGPEVHVEQPRLVVEAVVVHLDDLNATRAQRLDHRHGRASSSSGAR